MVKLKKSHIDVYFLFVGVILLILSGSKLSHGSYWEKTFGDTSYDFGSSIQQTTDGGFIIAGSYGQRFNYGDVYLIKTDVDGNEQWSKTFGEIATREGGSSVQQTTDNGFIIAGSTTEDYRNINTADVYLVKTDVDGNKQWSKTFGGSNFDWGSSIQQTTDGGFIIVGSTQSFGAGNYDVYLIKTDVNGNEQWSKTFGGNFGNHGRSVQQTTDGGFIIAGSTQSAAPVASDVYLIKTDVNGNEQWNKTYGGYSSDAGSSVQQTTDGGFIIAGSTESFGAGFSDVYLIKTDVNGNEQWSKTFGGSLNDNGQSVQQTTDGGFIIAGSTVNNPDTGYGYVYLVKTDVDGNEQWSETFGGNFYNHGRSVQQTTDGGFIIAGDTFLPVGTGTHKVYLIYFNTVGLSFTPVTPCRIVDTRIAWRAIPPDGLRSYNVRGAVDSQGGNPAGCPSPPQGEPRAVHLNVAAVPVAGQGHLRLFPFDTPTPNASILNYSADAGNMSNAVSVKTCYSCGKDVNVQNFGGTTHVVIDVMGYCYPKP